MILRLFREVFQFFIPLLCLQCREESPALVCKSCLAKIERPTFATQDPYYYGNYDGVLKELIHQFKFENKFSLSPLFAQFLSEISTKDIDMIIPVPMHFKKLKIRKYNPSVLMAKDLSKHLKIPYHFDILKKVIDTPSQTELSKTKRRHNVKGAYEVKNHMLIQGKKILLIDDVYTTGATVHECKRTLLKSGAHSVQVATLAKTMV